MPHLSLSNISKSYGEGAFAVNDVSLEITDGDFICLLGPSGCGKTTILRTLAGLEHLSAGRITLDGKDIDCPANGVFVPPERRKLGLVFQSYALWPHMSVAKNIAFGLRVQRWPADGVDKRVGEVMEKLGIARYADRYPSQLSGGQQQRVALARMLAVNPKVLLLDEPLSNLDAALRLEMRSELRRIHKEFGTTVVFVTHDQWEAMTLATTIAVMRDGKLQQVGTPDDIYMHPANSFVASFIGNPPINMLDAHGDLARVLAAGQGLGAAKIGLRPEDLRIGHAGVPVTVASILPTGGTWLIELEHGRERLILSTQHRPDIAAGVSTHCSVAPQDIHFFGPDGLRQDHSEPWQLKIAST